MSRSKLEKYLDILEAIVAEPLSLENISYQANIECRMLERYLSFLATHKLIAKRSLGNTKITYAITERGLAVFKTLQAQKYFQRLKKILPIVEEASEIEPLISKRSSLLEEDD